MDEKTFQTLCRDCAADIFDFVSGLQHDTAASNKNTKHTDFDPVTKTDIAIETLIRNRIRQLNASHAILGEEAGGNNTGAEICWIIDPIDGTRSFVSGSPLWTSLIGVMVNKIPAFGCVIHPPLRQIFWGNGLSASCETGSTHPVPIKSMATDHSPLITYTTDPYLFETRHQCATWEAVRSVSDIVRFSADGFAFMLLAQGHVHHVIETGLKVYDLVPLLPIIHGAGAIMTDWEGNALTFSPDLSATYDVLCSAQATSHRNMLSQINQINNHSPQG